MQTFNKKLILLAVFLMVLVTYCNAQTEVLEDKIRRILMDNREISKPEYPFGTEWNMELSVLNDSLTDSGRTVATLRDAITEYESYKMTLAELNLQLSLYIKRLMYLSKKNPEFSDEYRKEVENLEYIMEKGNNSDKEFALYSIQRLLDEKLLPGDMSNQGNETTTSITPSYDKIMEIIEALIKDKKLLIELANELEKLWDEVENGDDSDDSSDNEDWDVWPMLNFFGDDASSSEEEKTEDFINSAFSILFEDRR